MQVFLYKALKEDKLTEGELEGRDAEEIASKLKEKGLEVLNIKPKFETKGEIGKKEIPFLKRFQKVKKVEKVFLYKNLSTMLKAGLPLPETLDLLRESMKNEKLKDILGKLKYDVESGNYISASLAPHKDVFATSEISMIQAGEAGGTLPESFDSLFEDANSELQLQKDIKSALMYPIIILSILFVVVLLLLLFVLPSLTGFFEQASIEVPAMTRMTMAFSKFARQNFVFIAIFVVIMVFLIRAGVKRVPSIKKFYDKLILKVPLFGLQIKYFFIHKVARMLGLLIKSGVPILQALDIVSNSVSNTGYIASVKKMHGDIKSGGKLSETAADFPDLYPPFVSRMLTVGDRTGNTSDALENISEYYRTELQETLDNLASLIEPILMVFLGVGVAFIAISVLIPLYSIVSGINQMS